MTRTVLVADDEPAIRDFIGLVLDIGGFRVLAAPDGRQALEIARSEHPDLILLDVMMPEMDGRDACREMRRTAHLDGTPIVLFSGAPEADVDWHGAGAQLFIAKPFSAHRLRDVLTHFLGAPEVNVASDRPKQP